MHSAYPILNHLIDAISGEIIVHVHALRILITIESLHLQFFVHLQALLGYNPSPIRAIVSWVFTDAVCGTLILLVIFIFVLLFLIKPLCFNVPVRSTERDELYLRGCVLL